MNNKDNRAYVNKVILYRNMAKVQIGLKVLDTFGNCQRPVFSLAVSLHMHKVTNL